MVFEVLKPEPPHPHFERPPKVAISITATCNLECRHCYADCGGAAGEPELGTTEWRRFLDYLEANDVIQIYVEGGEPLHRPDIGEILDHCGRRFFTTLRTNGTLIDRAMARALRRRRVGRVLVDVMGADAPTHEYFTRVAGSFDRSCDAVRHLVAAGLDTDMLIILTRQNARQLQRYLELAASLGAQRVGILRLYPLGRARRCWRDLALSLDEQMAALRDLAPPPGLHVMQSWHPNDHNCCWQSAAVNPYGQSIGCPYLREYVSFGDIREIPLLEGWHRDPLYRQLRSGEVDGACQECHTTQGSRGGCRAAAYAFHGRWDAPDPFCPTMNRGVDLRVLPERRP